MISAPAFWTTPEGARHPLAWLLRPVAALYAMAVRRKLHRADRASAGVPVICVGNVTLGGVGKTPFTDFLVRMLSDAGETPFILMRGYGGQATGPLRVTPEHDAATVGDEARMLARHWPVIVSRDRPAGAALAVREGASVIVMDDGFQNPSLAKDFSFVLIDLETGFGNGLVFPAGPLRERPNDAFARAGAVVLVSNGAPTTAPLPMVPSQPLFRAELRTRVPEALKGAKAHAFSGIGRPEKFFRGLEDGGVDLGRTTSFPDHHAFSETEIGKLKQAALEEGAMLLTTEKDLARLPADLAQDISAVPATLSVEASDRLRDLVLHQLAGASS